MLGIGTEYILILLDSSFTLNFTFLFLIYFPNLDNLKFLLNYIIMLQFPQFLPMAEQKEILLINEMISPALKYDDYYLWGSKLIIMYVSQFPQFRHISSLLLH